MVFYWFFLVLIEKFLIGCFKVSFKMLLIYVIGWILRFFNILFGIFFKLCLLIFGIIMVLILLWWVVSNFFFKLLIGNILLCKVILFVIVILECIGLFVKFEIKLVIIVIFVFGLFFGVVFFGMWIWILCFLWKLLLICNFLVWLWIIVMVVWIDFCIILLSELVKVSLFLFGIVVDLIVSKLLFILVYVNLVIWLMWLLFLVLL